MNHCQPVSPRKSLNKAYLKVKPNRIQIEAFKPNLIKLLDHINDSESEEFHKNIVSDFLKNTWYSDRFFINTKGREDLTIYNGKDAKCSAGVIIEAKSPTNKYEMISKDNINCKAFHELILYYLRERITGNNLEVKQLIATNIFEWFIFDASMFEKLFAGNKSLVRQFTEFETKRMSGTSTDFFYKEIAAPFVDNLKEEISFTHFDLRSIEKPLRDSRKDNDAILIPFYKIFSPEHLLKLPFSNDSNSLDRSFYNELLHIIGLEETKEGSKKLIGRKAEGKRNAGSLIENTITILQYEDCLNNIKPSEFGSGKEEQLYNIALELVITWINRILFLKLLEGQLVQYHNGDKSFRFLNSTLIPDFDALNKLFFQVLAIREEDRNELVKKKFSKIPYLNSSLFEPGELEHKTIRISNLEDEYTLPVLTNTVLKETTGKRIKGERNALNYLFEFLDSYDFTSEGSEEIQEENKTLINASVLGLIFEKINGYKDGSFFTPGFITMYMCRETIRRAVVQKFNDVMNLSLTGFGTLLGVNSIDDIYNSIGAQFTRDQANEIINSIKICDPAVGSGHFLVSALNELIAIKSELKILTDRQGKILRDYHVEVINDELIVTDIDGKLFEYRPSNHESQRVQETLFHEKQTIIENCLFGVDINPNSVKICRLRLWIELLKNAYYKQQSSSSSLTGFGTLSGIKNPETLETLPNIDINIKCGNSLISRYALDADIKKLLRNSKWNIETYRIAVSNYRNAKSKEEKRELEKLILMIKQDFSSEIRHNDPTKTRLDKLANELYNRFTGNFLFEPSEQYQSKSGDIEKKKIKERQKIENEIKILTAKMDEIRNGKIFENSFEWRFEFPEVLNDEGDFVGFDVVIGNPPYIRQEEFSDIKTYLQNHFETYAGTADLYVYFVERGMQIAKQKGNFVYILPNKWMRAGYGSSLRKWVDQFDIKSIIDFGDLPVFEEATTYPCVWHMEKNSSVQKTFSAANIETLNYPNGMRNYIDSISFMVNQKMLPESGWTLVDDKKQQLLEKIKSSGISLGEYVDGKIFYGIKTGFNEAFVIDESTRAKLISEDPRSAEVIKPFLAGRDIKRYQQPKSDKYLILFKSGDTQRLFGKIDEKFAWKKLSEQYHAILKYLFVFEKKCKKRSDQGQYWWELRACDYYNEFEKKKIMLPDISQRCEALFDESQFYCVNTAYIIPGLTYSDLGILNSKLILFFYSNLTQTIRGGYFRFIRQYLEQIPFVKTSILDDKVKEIIQIKSQNPAADTTTLEAEIDLMVYKLYNLTWEEVKIVDSGFAMSAEEYEKVEV